MVLKGCGVAAELREVHRRLDLHPLLSSATHEGGYPLMLLHLQVEPLTPQRNPLLETSGLEKKVLNA